MKTYSSPEIEVVEIEVQDVITASGDFDIKDEGIFNGEIEWL